MDIISHTTSSSAFSWMKIFYFVLKFHWILFLSIQLTIYSIGSENGLAPSRDKPLSEPIMVHLPTHIYVTRPQWVNEWTEHTHNASTVVVLIFRPISANRSLEIKCISIMRIVSLFNAFITSIIRESSTLVRRRHARSSANAAINKKCQRRQCLDCLWLDVPDT